MDSSNELRLQENQMSLQHQQISDSIDIIQCSYLENSVTVLHRFDALENSNSFCFPLLSLFGMFSFNRLFSHDFCLYCTHINFILSNFILS